MVFYSYRQQSERRLTDYSRGGGGKVGEGEVQRGGWLGEGVGQVVGGRRVLVKTIE